MYTKEQIEEIGKRLGLLGIKDTQFPPAVPIDGTEVLALVQSGENRIIRVDDLCKELAKYIVIQATQSDWAETSSNEPSFIRNKPTLIDGAFSKIYVDGYTADASGEDTLEIEGSGNVSVSLNTTDKKLTITGSGGPGGAVDSVNGKTGVVVLNASDVNAYAKLNNPTKDDIVIFGDNGTLADSGTKISGLQTRLDACPPYEGIGSGTMVPVISTNNLGQVIGIDTTPVSVDISGKVNTVPSATENNLAAFTNNGHIKDSNISISYIQSLQSQINDLRAQLLGVSITATPITNVIVGKGATIDLEVTTTDTISGITIFRVLYPDDPETAQPTQIYTSSSSGSHWTFRDTYTDSAAPIIAGNTLAYRVIVGQGSAEKSTMVYVGVLEDRVVSLSWTGGSISPSTVEAGGTATLTKGTVTATYLSGTTSPVTNFATFSATGGTISGTTYTAPSIAGTYTIKVSYNNVTAPQSLSVTVTSVRLNVQVGNGASYANATFTNTNRTLSNNMIVSITTNAGDYLFIKVDKRDTVTNLYTYPGPNMPDFEYPITLESPIEDGNYKYYRSSGRYNAATAQFKINRTT